MSTPILDVPADTTGWLLEMTGTGDDTVYTAVKPGGDIIACALYALPLGRWYVSLCDGTPLKPIALADHDDAIAWLTYLANLNTRTASA